MKISDQLILTRDTVAPWAKENGGGVEIATKLVHLYSVLSAKPGAFRAAVFFYNELKRGEYEEAGMVDREYWVGFSYGEPMTLEKGDALVKGQAGGRPLADLLEELRDQVRAIQFDATTEVTPDYKGALPLQTIAEGFNIEGFYIRFTIGSLLPTPGTTND